MCVNWRARDPKPLAADAEKEAQELQAILRFTNTTPSPSYHHDCETKNYLHPAP